MHNSIDRVENKGQFVLMMSATTYTYTTTTAAGLALYWTLKTRAYLYYSSAHSSSAAS